MSGPGGSDRRELLIGAARLVCGAALAGLAGLLALRNGRAACGERRVCEACRRRPDCAVATPPAPGTDGRRT